MSRFKGIFEARQKEAAEGATEEAETAEETTPVEVAPPPPAPAAADVRDAPKPQKQAKSRPAPRAPAEPKKRGRPAGKRSDDEYGQVTAYIRKDTHRDVKVALIREGNGEEFSELVQELLAKWLRSRI